MSRAFLPLLALAGAVAAGTAHAQTPDRPAVASSPDAVTLDSITVTAERTERSLKDTATSALVLDRTALRQRGMDDSNDVLANIANITSTGTGNLAPTVRGVDGTGPAQGADAFFAGSRPRLNVQVDGRPLSYNEVVFGAASMWDVEQAEMLRGPQSTLQGRNAVAGTLAIRTADPVWETEAGVRLLAGNQRRRQAAFHLSGPLSEQVAYRIAGDFQTWRSFVDFEPYPGVREPEDFAVRTLRGKLLFEPKSIDGFRTLVTLQHASAHGPQVASEGRPFGEHVSDFPRMPVFTTRADTAIVDTQWSFAPRMSFESLLSYNDLLVERLAEPGTGAARISADEIVVEPRLKLSRGDGRIEGVAGLHLFRADQREFIDFPLDEHFDDRIDTAALFGEGVIAVGDDIDLTLGLRYEREHHERHGGDRTVVAIDIDETYDAFLPKLGLAWRPNTHWTIGAVAARGYNGGGGGITYDFPIVSYSFDPEYVNNYEAYFRGDLLDGRMQVTGNLFLGDYRDMQLPFDLNPDPSVWSVVVRNADRARNYGAEFGLRWLAVPGLTVHGDLGLLKTEVTRYQDSNIEGHEFANAPAVTADFGFAWQAGNGFDLSMDARYSDAYYSSIDNHPRGRTDPYWLLNARAGYDFGTARVFAYVDNLLDDETPILITPGATIADDVANLPQPRSFGIGLDLRF